MNTLLTDQRHEQQHQSALPPPRRVTPMDRIALHVGVALIRWSRRPALHAQPRYRRTMSHEDLVRVRRDMERVRTRSAEHDLPLLPR